MKFSDLSTVTMFVGLPGSGKTTFASHLVRKCYKKGIRSFSNVPLEGAYEFSFKKNFGFTDLSSSLIIIDESGLELDCRSWEKNFKPNQVQFLKLIRHYHSKIVLFSQTWNDTDTKMRSMVDKLFLVKRSILPGFSSAIPIFRRIDVDEDTKEFKELYYKDGWFFRIFSTKRIFRPLYYKFFDSWDCPSLPEYEYKLYGKE